jgi:hypothetical protein
MTENEQILFSSLLPERPGESAVKADLSQDG